jgi:Rab GDP dissociation inhibitor
MADVYKKFSLEETTQTFTGHALALELDDGYKSRPALATIEKIRMYADSVNRYGKSPYIYPLWGLGGLPEGFSRLCAIHGGVYMLDKKIDEIVYDSNGRVTGVRSGEETARCKSIIADPSYFIGTDKIRKTGQIACSISIMNHPIPDTNDSDSAQIIIPNEAVAGRTSDLYVCCVSYHHKVAAKGKYIAVVCGKVEGKTSTDAKDDVKIAQRELAPALSLIGPVEQQFFWLRDYYEPVNDSKADGCFISSSFDPTTHFESATNQVMDMYERITGTKLDLTVQPDPAEDEQQGGGTGGEDGGQAASGESAQ